MKSMKTKSKSRKTNGKLGRVKFSGKETPVPLDPDLASLRRPVDISVSTLQQVTKLLETGTDEVRAILAYECDLVYECRVCRSLFRSLVNFVSHKRVYCTEKFDVSFAGGASSDYEAVLEKNSGSRRSEKPAQDACANDRILRSQSTREEAKKDLTAVVDMLQKKHTKRSLRSEDRIILEDVGRNSSAVFQTLESARSTRRCADLMKTQVIELDELERRQTAVLGPDGLCLDDDRGDRDTEDDFFNGFGSGDDSEGCGWDSESRTYVCSVCGAKFSTRKTLSVHAKTLHTAHRMCYPCPCCAATFANSWSVYRHLFKVHRKSNEQVRKLRSQVQEKAFRKETSVTEDLERERSSKTSDKKLQYTDETQEWMDHLESDSELQRCGGCGKRFDRRAALSSHSQYCQRRIEAHKELLSKIKKPKVVLEAIDRVHAPPRTSQPPRAPSVAPTEANEDSEGLSESSAASSGSSKANDSPKDAQEVRPAPTTLLSPRAPPTVLREDSAGPTAATEKSSSSPEASAASDASSTASEQPRSSSPSPPKADEGSLSPGRPTDRSRSLRCLRAASASPPEAQKTPSPPPEAHEAPPSPHRRPQNHREASATSGPASAGLRRDPGPPSPAPSPSVDPATGRSPDACCLRVRGATPAPEEPAEAHGGSAQGAQAPRTQASTDVDLLTSRGTDVAVLGAGVGGQGLLTPRISSVASLAASLAGLVARAESAEDTEANETSIRVEAVASLSEEDWDMIDSAQLVQVTATGQGEEEVVVREEASPESDLSEAPEIVYSSVQGRARVPEAPAVGRKRKINGGDGRRANGGADSAAAIRPVDQAFLMEQKIASLANLQKLQCLPCKRRFTSVTNLRRHVAIHVGWNRFRCKLCDFKCFVKCDCVAHCNRHHNARNDRAIISDMIEEIPEADYPCDGEILLDVSPLEDDRSAVVPQSKPSVAPAESVEAREAPEPPDEQPCKAARLDSDPDLRRMVMEVIFGSADAKDPTKETAQEKRSPAEAKVAKEATKAAPKAAKESQKPRRPIRNRIKPLNKDFIYDLKEVAFRKDALLLKGGFPKAQGRKAPPQAQAAGEEGQEGGKRCKGQGGEAVGLTGGLVGFEKGIGGGMEAKVGGECRS